MPKKRHHTLYSKPPSTAPASLRSSASAGHHNDNPTRSVNEILADLRRVRLSSAQAASSVPQLASPSLPPAIRHILQLPETPAPPPRRPARVDPRGRRLPPGPPPPQSWLSRPVAGGGGAVVAALVPSELPGTYRPERGSLIDIALRRIALDWEFQRSWGRYYLYALPNHLRMALVAYLAAWHEPGASLADLRAIFLPPPADGEDDGPGSPVATPGPDPSVVNGTVTHLDLSGAVGRSLKLRELSDLLFPSPPYAAVNTGALQDSWDAPEPSADDPVVPRIPQPLLPGLTHLSLALRPFSTSSTSVSWRQLLALAAHLPTLTHLSLAFWPEPTLTPNAKLVTVASPRGPIPYGGTTLYSHSLDDDWSEAVLLLRRLSKQLYGLEHLDLTGCAAWWPALVQVVDHDAVDWVAAWGKLETLVLRSGAAPPAEGDEDGAARRAYAEGRATARRVERHIRSQRAGRGRRITVEPDAEVA